MFNIVKMSLLMSFFLIVAFSALSLDLTSPAFREGEYIPEQYTCSSSNYSPPLFWSNIPPGTKSFAIICDDPDAPFGVWVHWVIFNIPAEVDRLEENMSSFSAPLNKAIQGLNSFKKIGYGGPCPPAGKPHRYFFKLYALDTELKRAPPVDKNSLLKAMNGHMLEEAQLMGLYRH